MILILNTTLEQSTMIKVCAAGIGGVECSLIQIIKMHRLSSTTEQMVFEKLYGR